MLQWACILITTLTLSCLLLSQSAKDLLPCIWTSTREGIVMLERRISVVGASGNAFQITLVTIYWRNVMWLKVNVWYILFHFVACWVTHILRHEHLRQGSPDGLYKWKINSICFVIFIQVSWEYSYFKQITEIKQKDNLRWM